jgi:SAM-dependent methyltransferase
MRTEADPAVARLKEHFTRWRDFLHCYRYSGYALVDRVRALAPDASLVLDVGCGYNRFKGRLANLIGCDIVNPKADLVMDLMELPFREGSADCILALGSINFFSREHVTRQIRFLRSLLKPGGHLLFRGNPGEYGIVDRQEVVLFPWSPQAIREIADELGFDLLVLEKDVIDHEAIPEEYRRYGSAESFRYYWEYRKR